jgi:putative transposase
MPARRVQSQGTYAHFVTFTCYKRRKFLNPDVCKRIVLGALTSQLTAQQGVCCGFVIMPDHVHGLIWFPEENQISLAMNKWKELSSSKIAAAYEQQFRSYWGGLKGDTTVWQARYYGFNIYSGAKLREKLTYMHNNPVRAGLVKDPCDWQWSSARWYLRGERVGILVSLPP